MSVATTDEQRAVQDAIRSWAGKARPVAAVRAAESDPARPGATWSSFAALGFLAVALPEECGGAGGTMVDLAAVVEEAASCLVPGPVLGTVLTGQLLGRVGGPVAQKLLPGLADGELAGAVALDTGGLTAERVGEGIVVAGTVGPVLGADESATLVLGARCGAEELWFVLDAGTAGVGVQQRDPADLTRTLADVQLDQLSVSADRVLAGVQSALVRDLAATLFAAECAGVAGWCLRTATEYARVREQFGRPIGAFQAVKHLCAEMLCREAVATAVAWDAAAAAQHPDELPLAAAVAAAVAMDAAVENAKDCIQVLGGIGFTWEHDAHYYLRRALTLRQLLGGSASWRRRAAELALQGSRRTLGIDLGAEAEAHRAEIRARAEQLVELAPEQQRAALAESGFFAPHWPRPHGLDASPAEQLLTDQELRRVKVSRPNVVVGGWAVPTTSLTGQRSRSSGSSVRP